MRREPLGGCWNLAFERVAPVRGFASFRGRRNRPGLLWFSGAGEYLGHESWLERDGLMALRWLVHIIPGLILRLPGPVGEVVASGQGVGVLGAGHPLLDGQ